MNFNDYQKQAQWTFDRSLDNREQLILGALGACGEAGEVAELVKKHLYHGHALDVAKVRAELGDVLWYVSALASHLGLSLADVAQGNLDKLRARYPEGFDPERSLNRTTESPVDHAGHFLKCFLGSLPPGDDEDA